MKLKKNRGIERSTGDKNNQNEIIPEAVVLDEMEGTGLFSIQEGELRCIHWGFNAHRRRRPEATITGEGGELCLGAGSGAITETRRSERAVRRSAEEGRGRHVQFTALPARLSAPLRLRLSREQELPSSEVENGEGEEEGGRDRAMRRLFKVSGKRRRCQIYPQRWGPVIHVARRAQTTLGRTQLDCFLCGPSR